MNTEQIDRILKNDTACKRSFQGVFSVNTLPNNPRLLVCNTDPSHKPGTHWISIYVDQDTGRGEYFDTFGRPPEGVLKDYMNEHCTVWTFNSKQLQSIISSFCGYYCCVYCMFRSRGFVLNKITSMFTNDTGFNDSIAHGFVCRLINKR